MDSRQRQAASFGAAADAYERGRPSYPEDAVDWLLPTHATRVLDLAAGTGKLARQLVARGLDVVAVDPSEGMLEQLRAAVPGVPAFQGTAESIPLDDDAVDAVLVAQAWHWVDPPRAALEVARVLRPGGRLGLIWNQRDERVDWVAELGRLTAGGVRHDIDHPVVPAPFGELETFETEWTYELDVQGVTDLVASRSYAIVMPAAEREALLQRVRELAERELERAGAEHLAMPYVTYCFRAHVQDA
jgi:ubiquinone/menaquinone biosynthesis C-methylase UbiE